MSKNIFFSLFISFFSSYIIAQASVDEVSEPVDSSGILDELIDQKSDAIIKYAKQFMIEIIVISITSILTIYLVLLPLTSSEKMRSKKMYLLNTLHT